LPHIARHLIQRNRPISVYRLCGMPIQSCGQSVSAPRVKAGARLNAHTELRGKHQRSARKATHRNQPIARYVIQRISNPRFSSAMAASCDVASNMCQALLLGQRAAWVLHPGVRPRAAVRAVSVRPHTEPAQHGARGGGVARVAGAYTRQLFSST
jgi:hypothetical protein